MVVADTTVYFGNAGSLALGGVLIVAFVATVTAGYADATLMVGTGLLVISSLSVFTVAPTPTTDTRPTAAD